MGIIVYEGGGVYAYRRRRTKDEGQRERDGGDEGRRTKDKRKEIGETKDEGRRTKGKR